jgi:cysteine desulfurase
MRTCSTPRNSFGNRKSTIENPMSPDPIYLDNNATTRVLPEVLEAMSRHWRDAFANPGSRHLFGRRARQALETARESLGSILGALPDEIIFTSGGTESNNMAVLG